MKRIVWLLVPLALAGCENARHTTAVEIEPAASRAAPDGTLPGEYLVTFHAGVADAPGLARQLVAAHRGTLRYTYEHAIRGFAATLPPQAAEALARNPNVARVEPDGLVSRFSTTQHNATWGLDRIDQRDRPLNGTYVYDQNGTGVRVYVLDTGIRTTHSDFGGRAFHSFTAIHDGWGSSDCNGHGTHVAGTVGGTIWGVAKNVALYSVRVLDCWGWGTWGGVIAGVDHVTAQKQANPSIPMVANMSLGGGANSTVDNAVVNSINAGVTYVVAAGNENQSACNVSPARVSPALTVGASQSNDARWYWNSSQASNWGSCVNIFAPGDQITSAWHTSNTATNTITGTSMAAPHAAGVAALYLQANPSAAPSTVKSAIENNATVNRLSSIGRGSPNRLLYSRFGGGGAPPLSVFMFCEPGGMCEATSSGGTGGNSWSWVNASMTWGQGDWSFAQPHCWTWNLTVTVTVTDSSGQSASASSPSRCSSGGIIP